jgi:anthranilate phosphoribosyltransferase
LPDVHAVLKHLLTGQPLSEAQSEEVFALILSGALDHGQIGAMLALISARPSGGPSVDELVGGARVMRRFVTPVPRPAAVGGPIIDTCGTGGAPKAFNVSTVAAIVTAAAAPGRVMVAKHGSVSRTGRGSAEVLEALGVNTGATPEVQSRCLRDAGVCFSFAMHHHPAMKHAAPVRKALGFPTIFNLLGPLINPAGARRQLMGTYSQDLALKLAHTLARLGCERAMVVTSHDGLDELSTTNTNVAHTVTDGRIETRVIDAQSFGLARASIADLQADSLDAAKDVFLGVLEGRSGPARDIVLLNAGAALLVADCIGSLGEGVEMARAALDSGAARRTLDELVRLSNA